MIHVIVKIQNLTALLTALIRRTQNISYRKKTKHYTKQVSDRGVIISLKACKKIVHGTSSYSEKNMGGVCSGCTSGEHNIRTIISNIHLLPLDVPNLQARLLATSFQELLIITIYFNLQQVYCSKGRSSTRVEHSSDLSHCRPIIVRAFRISDKLTHNRNVSDGQFASFMYEITRLILI